MNDGLDKAGEALQFRSVLMALYGTGWIAWGARRLGVSERMVAYMARGDRPISRRHWNRLAALGDARIRTLRGQVAARIQAIHDEVALAESMLPVIEDMARRSRQRKGRP